MTDTLATLPARCELATWHPVPNFGYVPARTLAARAFVVHSAEGHGDPPPRFYDGSSASAHFWNKADGTLLQLVELNQCAWANGQLNRLDGGSGAPAIVRGWYEHQVNPNWFTVSMEHEGVAGEPLTPPQLANTIRVAAWLESHGLRLSTENLIQHCDISATSCPSNRVPIAVVLDAIHDKGETMPNDTKQLDELNAAMVKRFAIIAIASGTDADGYAKMLAAYDALKAKGLV